MSHYFQFLLFFLSILSGHCNEFKLSDSKVLLPRTSFLSINYTIKGSPNICHEWISETPEVVAITPIYDHDNLLSKCSHQAIITSVWQSNNKATGTVYAKNIGTGHSVKCDVIIDQIRKLEIETRTLELYLHETPEALIARAFDEYGNTFSTLDGIPFEWLIHTTGSNMDAQNVLRFITWTESEYSTPFLIGSLEQQGLQGYMQLVSGLKTGSAKVSLSFRDEKTKTDIMSSHIRLLVMANAVLSPPVAYLILNTRLSFKINLHSQGSTQEIKMPNNQYYLKIENTEVAELDTKSSTITALKFGQTEVTLIDKNIVEDFHHPSSLIYVVEPGFLTLNIHPYENQWVLQTNHDNIYTITVRPFDFNSHPIFMSDNIRLETTIPTSHFEILHSTPNGTYNVVRAIKEGNTKLTSKMMSIILPNGTQSILENPVEGTQDLIIFSPISVIPHKVVLPWYPDYKIIPGYLLGAIGGSGEYKWLIQDGNQKANNFSVSLDGKGHVKPLNPGVSTVIAADQRNQNNKGFSTISVSVILNLEFILDRVEVEVKSELYLPIMAIDDGKNKMAHCHWLPFQVVSEDTSIIEIIEILSSKYANNSDSCVCLKIRGLKPGFSKITISLRNLLSNSSSEASLSTSITIGSFHPTKFIDPYTISSTIGVRSIRIMNIINGPLPWVLDPSQYFYEMIEDIKTKQIINKINLIEGKLSNKLSVLSLKIQCINIGNIDVKVTIGNKPSLKNPNPIISVGSVKLICTIPVRIKLVPNLLISNVSSTSCPFKNTSENHQITINNKDPLAINIVLTDKNGIQLERSESFTVKVEIKSLSKKNIREIVENVSPSIIYSDKVDENLIISSKFYVKPYRPGLSNGEIEVIAKINSYRDGKGPALDLTSRLHLQISKSMLVEPKRILLYQHEKVSAKFSVKYGSGYFTVSTPSFDILQVNRFQTSAYIDEEVYYEVIQTKVDFNQRNCIIYVVDSCFNSLDAEFDNSKSIEIELVKPFKLQLLSLNRIQLGSQINVLLKVYDDTGREFPQDALSYLNFDLHFNDDLNVISAHSLNSNEWFISPSEYSPSSGFVFKINGDKLGFGSLCVKLTQNTNIISNVLKIEVFSPLKLISKHIVLLEGAEMQLSTTGGPQNCHELLYYSIITNDTIKTKEAKIEFVPGPNGLIKAINHGEISVTMKVEVSDLDPTLNNQLALLSKDEGRVGVVQIKSISIWSPSKNLLAGNSMPLWITFTSSLNDLQHIPITGFSMTGLEKTEISFKWHLNPPQGVISKLENIVESVGINIDNKYLHSGMRLITANPGKQTIEVSATDIPERWLSKDLKSYSSLTSKLSIAIGPRLEIVYPCSYTKTLLLPPATRISLKSTLTDEATVSYSLISVQNENAGLKMKSRIHSNNILETNPHLSGNEVEKFILHISSSQLFKLNADNDIINQTVALFVTVKHPTYSMLLPLISSESLFYKFKTKSRINKYSDIHVLPLGGPFEFRISNHDELGNIFDISPDSNMFSYRIHRSDNIAITLSTIESLPSSINVHEKPNLNIEPILKYMDSTSFSSQKVLQFQGLGIGDNTIQLFYFDYFSDSPLLVDIISIPTGSVLGLKDYPYSFVIEGTCVKYRAPFDNGYWYASDREIVSIDRRTGEAIIKKHGSSKIFYSLVNNHDNENLQNKNVLISKELFVHSATEISMNVFDGALSFIEDSCINNDCIPINFNFQYASLVAAIYISSTNIASNHTESNLKFDKEVQLNTSEYLRDDIPVECGIDFDNMKESIINSKEIYKSLFKVIVFPLETEFDNQLGIKQWGCHVSPNSFNIIHREEFTRLILSTTSDLYLKIKTRLRNKPIKSKSISIPIFLGYVLLLSNTTRKNLIIKESGEVITSIRIALSMSTKNIILENKHIKLNVFSSRPSLLEVMAPREQEQDSGIWVYPLKAAVVDKIVNEKLEIIIEFALTKQRDVIPLQINIHGKSGIQKSSSNNSNLDELELSQVNWLTPVLCVLITATIAISIVMLVNYIIQPRSGIDKSTSSPVKESNMSSNSLPYSSLHTTPGYTHHIWNSAGYRRDSPPFNEYTSLNNRYSNIDSNFSYKYNY